MGSCNSKATGASTSPGPDTAKVAANHSNGSELDVSFILQRATAYILLYYYILCHWLNFYTVITNNARHMQLIPMHRTYKPQTYN